MNTSYAVTITVSTNLIFIRHEIVFWVHSMEERFANVTNFICSSPGLFYILHCHSWSVLNTVWVTLLTIYFW